MSKSLGNSLLVGEVLKRIPALHLRYYLAGSHYRSMLEYSDSAVQEAGQGFIRISGFIDRAMEALDLEVVHADLTTLNPKFVEEMNNDFGVPNAIAVIHEVVREGNTDLTNGDLTAVKNKVSSVVSMLDVLGMNPLDPIWATTTGNDQEIIGELVQVAINQRKEARDRKDYAAADAIRADLERIGIALEDTKDGVRWSVRPNNDNPH
jgi:cysteinyl-tRNA synthetase